MTDVQQMSMLSTLEGILFCLPRNMRAKRIRMPAKKGYQPGIRPAAKEARISPTTYMRIEKGGTPDMVTLLRILEWLQEEDVT